MLEGSNASEIIVAPVYRNSIITCKAKLYDLNKLLIGIMNKVIIFHT